MNLRGQDTARLMLALAALGISVALAAALAFVSASVNRPPVIENLESRPAVLPAGATGTVRVTASDPDGDRLRFDYAAEFGRLVADKDRPAEARYVPAPEGPLADRVTVTVTDPRGLASSRSILVTVERAAPAAAPTEEPPSTTSEATPAMILTPVPTRTRPPVPTRVPRNASAPAPAVAAPAVAATPPAVNHPPVLDGGYSTAGIGGGPITLVATGHDPDDDPITYEWDTGGCFELRRQSQTEAEILFIDECKMGTVNLVWTDAKGATASTRWTLRR